MGEGFWMLKCYYNIVLWHPVAHHKYHWLAILHATCPSETYVKVSYMHIMHVLTLRALVYCTTCID